MTASREHRLHRRLAGGLYTEAMLLADEARAYFDEAGRADREALDPATRVGFSCESLKVTTRLMHVIAWLLTQRAIEIGEVDAADPGRRLDPAPQSDLAALHALPERARGLIAASVDLHRRVERLDLAQTVTTGSISPARGIQERLAAAF